MLEQYPVHVNIPTYNFYYEADETHNPDRQTVWTDVYLDPAGSGWITSCIAPIYVDDTLEGVAGFDVTLDTIIQQVLNLDIAWEGYAVLIGEDGTILALPEQGELDWGINELTDYHYSEAILEDTYKPESFNIYKFEDLEILESEMGSNESGLLSIKLNGDTKLVTWQTIDLTGWKLLSITSEGVIYAGINDLNRTERNRGLVLLAGLIVFSVMFFYILFSRSKILSSEILNPLFGINDMAKRIGQGEFEQANKDFGVIEAE